MTFRKGLMLSAAGLALGAVALSSVEIAAAHRGEGGPKGGWHRDGGHHGKGHKGHGMKGGGVMRMLEKLDANGDGTLTQEEVTKASDDKFAELDSDANGSLTADELAAPGIARRAWREAAVLKAIDHNLDGKVDKADFEAHARERFAARDFNGNGTIDDDEMPPRKAGRGPDRDKNDDRGGERRRDRDDDEARGEGRGERWEGRADREERGERDRGKGWRGKQGGDVRTIGEAIDKALKRFADMDANGDGVFDAKDFASRDSARDEFKKKARLSRLDADKNGTVSREEFRAKLGKRFARADLDGDGSIGASDLPPGAAEKLARKRARAN
ncbi:MAG: hypothetical protein NW205_10795 [Hyphomicrobiaceae bacterium]|nr:hypothetical protein [Hyphomicrobiaceae bacterium]